MSILRAHINDEDFAGRFAALQAMKREQSVDVNEAVAAIIDDVRQRGDDALIALTEKYDRQTLNAETLRIGDDEIDAAMQACAPETKAALELAAQRIGDFHARKSRKMRALPMRPELKWAIAGRRLMRPVFMCRAVGQLSFQRIDECHSGARAGVGRVVMVVPTPTGR